MSMMRRVLYCASIAAVLASSADVWAGLSQDTGPTPGGFVQAGAAPSTTGANAWPGVDIIPEYVDSGFAYNYLFNGVGESTALASYSYYLTTNFARGTVGLGYLHMQADNSSSSASPHAGAATNGGWNEVYNITDPTLDGQDGYMIFSLHVDGLLQASGLVGAASFTTTAYKDGVQLAANPYFNAGNSDTITTDRQYGNWSVSTDAVDASAGQLVDDTVTFAVPFTFGTPFTLGVYAKAFAGMHDVIGTGSISTGHAHFINTLNWGGISTILDANDNPVDSYSIVSGSGQDWSGAIVPEPASIALMNLAACVLLSRRRRHA